MFFRKGYNTFANKIEKPFFNGKSYDNKKGYLKTLLLDEFPHI